MTNKNIQLHRSLVSREDRSKRNGHRSVIIWFTGLSGSGKSTIAHALERRLFELSCSTFVFDGDNVRHGLCSDLGFTQSEREENIRRIGEMAKLFIEAGVIAITAFISPYRSDREKVRRLINDKDLIEIYCDCPLEVCEQRDVKGLYAKARQGKIANFTGVTAPYEPPLNPQLILETSKQSIEECVNQVLDYLIKHSILHKNSDNT